MQSFKQYREMVKTFEPRLEFGESNNFSLVHSGSSLNLVIEADDGDKVEVIRERNRWRLKRGYPVSCTGLAEMLLHKKGVYHTSTKEIIADTACYLADIGFVVHQANLAIEQFKKDFIRVQRENQAKENLEREYLVNRSKRTPLIYLMKHTNGLTKIGRSVNPKAREKTLQAEDPRLEMIFCCEGDGSTEIQLHKIFQAVRVRGEWFDLMDHHVDWIIAVLKSEAAKLQVESN